MQEVVQFGGGNGGGRGGGVHSIPSIHKFQSAVNRMYEQKKLNVWEVVQGNVV